MNSPCHRVGVLLLPILAIAVLVLVVEDARAHGGFYRLPKPAFPPKTPKPTPPPPTRPRQPDPCPTPPPSNGEGGTATTPPDSGVRGPSGEVKPGARTPTDGDGNPPTPTPDPEETPKTGTPEAGRGAPPPGTGGAASNPTATPGSVGGRPRPRSGGDASSPSWSRWWLYNRDRFVSIRSLELAETPASDRGKDNPRAEFWRELAIDALSRSLGDSHPDPSTGSALALGKADARTAAPRLCRLLLNRSTEATLRESSALALGMLGGETGAEALRAILASPHDPARLRAFAAIGLGLTGRPDALPVLVEAAQRKKEFIDVRAASFVALGLLGDPVVTPVLVDAVRNRGGRFQSEESAAAIHALGMLRDPDGLKVLVTAAVEGRPEIRRSAYLAIGRVSRPTDPVAHRLLVRAARGDRDPRARAYAAIALGRLGATRGAAPLCEMMDGANASLRGFAAMGLALLVHRNGDDDLRARVAQFLRYRLARKRLPADVKGAVMIALGLLRDRESKPLVLRVFKSEGDPRVRGWAAMSLGLLGSREALPALREALTEERDPWVQREVALSLGLLADSGSVRTLADLVKTGRSEYVRANAALALGCIAGPTAARSMIEMLGEKTASGPTRGMAAVALGYLLDRRTYPVLARISEDLDYSLPVASFRELLSIL